MKECAHCSNNQNTVLQSIVSQVVRPLRLTNTDLIVYEVSNGTKKHFVTVEIEKEDKLPVLIII